jgi:diphthamide synthase (EF-2-diphthine--ammonia ligase)
MYVQVMLPFPCSNEDYQRCMLGAIQAAREAGIQAVAFGDLFLAEVREYREKNMAGTGLSTLFPLWLADSGKSTAQLAREMQAAGVKAVITCLDPKKLPKGFAGRFWDAQLLQEIEELGNGVDPCGENGEFHTFVCDGPMFSAALDITVGDVVERDGFVFCDVLPVGVPLDQPVQQAEQQQKPAAAAAQEGGQQQQTAANAELQKAAASMVRCPGQQ